MGILVSAVGLIYDHRLFDKDQHDIRRFLHRVLISIGSVNFIPTPTRCGNKLLLQPGLRLARDIRADKLNIVAFRFDHLHRDGAAVSHYQLSHTATDLVILASFVAGRNDDKARSPRRGRRRDGLIKAEMNIVDQVAERLIICRRRIGAEGKDGLLLPVWHGVAAAIRKLPRRIVRAVCAVIAPGVVTRADDPDIPFLRVHVGRRSAERIPDIILEAAVCGKLFGVDRDLLRTAHIGNGHAHIRRVLTHPVRHAHELIPAILARLGRVNVLLRADNDRHLVDAHTAAVGKTPLIHIAADRRGILIKRALFVGVQLRKLVPIRNSLVVACKLGSIFAVPPRSELDLLVGCRCMPVMNQICIPLRRILIVKRRLLKAAVFDGVVRNAARIGRQNRSWQQTQCHYQHHQSADGPLFPISFDVHDRSSLLLWGVKEVSNPLFLLMHRIGL